MASKQVVKYAHLIINLEMAITQMRLSAANAERQLIELKYSNPAAMAYIESVKPKS